MPTDVAPTNPPAREYRSNLSHTLRRTIAFNSGAFTMPASLPAGTLITSTQILVETAFSAGASLVVGTTVGGNDIVTAADSAVTAAGIKRPETATLKGRLATDTVLYGTIAGAPAAGVATVVLHYVPNNDG